MRPILKFAIAALFLTALPACKNKEKEQRRTDLQALMHGNTPDPAIKEAMAKAQSTVGEFLTAIQQPGVSGKDFMVRKVFPAEAGKQQVLLITELTYDGTALRGMVRDNSAKPGSGIPKDGKVTILPSEVVDWMYIKDGVVVGGQMLRALKTKMTPEEWAAYDRQFTERGITFKD